MYSAMHIDLCQESISQRSYANPVAEGTNNSISNAVKDPFIGNIPSDGNNKLRESIDFVDSTPHSKSVRSISTLSIATAGSGMRTNDRIPCAQYCTVTSAKYNTTSPSKMTTTQPSFLKNEAASCSTKLQESMDIVELSPNAKSIYDMSSCNHTITKSFRSHVSHIPVAHNKSSVVKGRPAENKSHNGRKSNKENRNIVVSEVEYNAQGVNPSKDASRSKTNLLISTGSRIPVALKPQVNVVDEMEEEELPATQIVKPSVLASVIAYVEVRTGDDNRSWGVKEQLRKLGATIVDRFTKIVTHVVFKEGSMATYKKALKLKVHLVSALWIEECKNAMTIVAEELYPPYDMERYESPHLFPKLRKVKSMQPDFENKREEEYFKRRRKRPMVLDNLQEQNKILDLLYPYPTKTAVDNSPSFIRTLKSVATIEPGYDDYINRTSSPTPSEEEDPPPLAIRILREYLSPYRPKIADTSCTDILQLSSLQLVDAKSPISKENSETCQKSTKNDNVFQALSSNYVNSTRCDKAELIAHKKTDDSSVSLGAETKPSDDKSYKAILVTPTRTQQVSVNRRKSLRQAVLATKSLVKVLSQQVDSSLFEESNKLNTKILDADKNIGSNQHASNYSTLENLPPATRRKKKLMNVSQLDDSLTEFTPPPDDELPIRPKFPYPVSKPRQSTRSSKSTFDMELTLCVPTSNMIVVNNVSKCKSGVENKPLEEFEVENLTKRRCTRRSSMFFKEIPLHPSKVDISVSLPKASQVPTIVCTSLHTEASTRVSLAIKTLGGYEIEEKVSSRTSHVVTDLPPRRTLNLLKGIARGCWVVKEDWVTMSLKAGKWVDEEKYEFTEFSPMVQQYRIEKLSFGPAYMPDVFSNCGAIYVCKNTAPPSKDLIEIITLCGGRIITNARCAEIIIGPFLRYVQQTCVKEVWVLDSVTDGVTKDVQEYSIKQNQQNYIS